REAITHSLLTHPNVLPFLGIHQETEDSPPIIILPFLRHGSLRDRLCSGELIDAESFQRILLGISRGVQYLHSRYPPVVHGDLHPGNVLLDDSGDPNLCDFGLSRIRHEVTRTYTMLREGGNLRFMAPEFTSSTDEQFRTTREGDIFSLSMMFLSAWTGKLPFSEFSNPKAAAARLRRLERPSIPNNAVALTPDVKQGFWDLLSKMWSQDPSDRPSIDVVVARLEELFDHCKQASLMIKLQLSFVSKCQKPLTN
ncbi:kinase-like protein, partial [Clavulina sp. PMI_390]